MKKYFIIFLLLINFTTNFGQKNRSEKLKTWYTNNFNIRQSLEMVEFKEEPAQFQITIPDSGNTSFLLNVGVSFNFNLTGKAKQTVKRSFLKLKINTEYHLNTLYSKKQNNLQAGVGFTWRFPKSIKANCYFSLLADLKYVYDRVDSVHSLASNILFTGFRDESKFRFNAQGYFAKRRLSYFLGVYGGGQLQGTLHSDKSQYRGFIFRPIVNSDFSITYNRYADSTKTSSEALVKLSASYTGRYDVINTTQRIEGYTHLIKAGIDFYIISDPIEISIGGSYSYGSDPLKGLQQQHLGLISLNIMK